MTASGPASANVLRGSAKVLVDDVAPRPGVAPAVAVQDHTVSAEDVAKAGTFRHARHQLVWAPDGLLAIQTADNDWVIAPTHALWIPAGVVHGGRALRPGRLYLIYVDPSACGLRWTEPTGLAMPPLVRELIAHLAREDVTGEPRRRAEAVLLDLLEPATTTTLHIPLPRDPRARAVADALVDDPADPRDLAAWSVDVHASVRTLTRAFAAETGMTFTQWRAQVRMRAALDLLADGLPVATVARRVGYTSAAAFATAFRRVTGHAPGTGAGGGA